MSEKFENMVHEISLRDIMSIGPRLLKNGLKKIGSTDFEICACAVEF